VRSRDTIELEFYDASDGSVVKRLIVTVMKTTKEAKRALYEALLGTKEPIDAAVSQRTNVHFNIGKTLNYIRSEILRTIPDVSDKMRFRATVQRLSFQEPQPGDSKQWLIPSAEARRLYSQLEPLLRPIGETQTANVPQAPLPVKESRMTIGKGKVFVVHGHDEAVRETVARFLEKLGLDAIILNEQVSGGIGIMEKFEKYAAVDFAIVLLTPDDEGRAKGAPDFKARARQNVILELGYFIGKLGRGHVCALHKDSIEIPSDYAGIVYVQYDLAGGWKQVIAKEMKSAGLKVDMNAI
jgi:predicted nucleotide-binding protein